MNGLGQIKQLKMLVNYLPMIEQYVNYSKEYFEEVKKVLENSELNDSDKVIMINNQLKEFENSIPVKFKI